MDYGILEYVKDNKIIVATMDKILRRKLKNKSKIMSIRNKKKIIVL